MQKLKLSVINTMIMQKLTNAEVDFILYISKYQAEDGSIHGVYYKSVCKTMDISIQKFYDLKNSLVNKGIIEASKEDYTDWDIKILNNDFSYSDAMKEGYINTNQTIFCDPAFKELKAGEKLLAMQFLKMYGAGERSIKIGVKKFYEKYSKIFGVGKRILQHYMTSLKKLFSIGIKEKLYWITPLKKTIEKTKKKEVDTYNEYALCTICRRRKLKFDMKSFQDTLRLLKQYAAYGVTIGKLEVAIVKSLIMVNANVLNKHKWDLTLHPALVHKILKDYVLN